MIDVERTIEFLLAQQARFDEQHEQSASEMAELRGVVLDLADTQPRTNEILVTLAERHVELAAEQKITEQNLNALITTVERHISGHD